MNSPRAELEATGPQEECRGFSSLRGIRTGSVLANLMRVSGTRRRQGKGANREGWKELCFQL